MKKKKDALDKLFVNCNEIPEHEAKEVLTSVIDLSLKSWKWDFPYQLEDISKADINRFKTFIGVGRWKSSSKKRQTKYILIAKRGELIYLEPEIVRIMYNSLKELKAPTKSAEDKEVGG